MEFCFIGDPKLKQQSEEISFENNSKEELQEIIDNLKFTVVATRGVGYRQSKLVYLNEFLLLIMVEK